MEYFLLKPFQGGMKLRKVGKNRDFLSCSVVRKGELPDFTMSPEPLISNRLKELIEMYLPSMEFGPCILEGGDGPELWTLQVKEADTSQALYRPDGSVSAVSPMGRIPIFMVPNYKKISYIVNLALAESILRRGFVNLGLERIETLGGDKIWTFPTEQTE